MKKFSLDHFKRLLLSTILFWIMLENNNYSLKMFSVIGENSDINFVSLVDKDMKTHI